MTDIVERLRNWVGIVDPTTSPESRMAEAADEIEARDAEIERLRTENAELRKAQGEPVAVVRHNGLGFPYVELLGKNGAQYFGLEDGTKLYTSAAAEACKYGDPYCPCQDGDPCHYEGDNPMTPPAVTELERFVAWWDEWTKDTPSWREGRQRSVGWLIWKAATEAEREACAELLEQQHTWISNVAAANLVRARSNAEVNSRPQRTEQGE